MSNKNKAFLEIYLLSLPQELPIYHPPSPLIGSSANQVSSLDIIQFHIYLFQYCFPLFPPANLKYHFHGLFLHLLPPHCLYYWILFFPSLSFERNLPWIYISKFEGRNVQFPTKLYKHYRTDLLNFQTLSWWLLWFSKGFHCYQNFKFMLRNLKTKWDPGFSLKHLNRLKLTGDCWMLKGWAKRG